MAAKQKKEPSKRKKSDTKTAVIVLIIAVLGIALFMYFHKPKEKALPVKITPVVKPVAKVVRKVVKPETVPIPKPVIQVPAGSAGKIAFVIDDWGYTTRNCKYLTEIKAPLAIAILPNLRRTQEVLKCSSLAGKTVMLHLPLEPFNNNDRYPDNYLITTRMKPDMVEKLIEDTLLKMPSVVGVNNHMGSKALESKPLMKHVLRILKKHRLFFMDSMTSPHHSVGAEVAAEVGIPFAQRDVFLDNINTREAILKQFDELRMKTKKGGYAIAIGHDRELTMKMLKEVIPILQAQGFEIVSVKDLLKFK